jgi:hypothetical protein
LEGPKNEHKPSAKLQLNQTRMLGYTFNCFIFLATFHLLSHLLGREGNGLDTHCTTEPMIKEILAPDKKEIFRNKRIFEKATLSLDTISAGDIDSAQLVDEQQLQEHNPLCALGSISHQTTTHHDIRL